MTRTIDFLLYRGEIAEKRTGGAGEKVRSSEAGGSSDEATVQRSASGGSEARSFTRKVSLPLSVVSTTGTEHTLDGGSEGDSVHSASPAPPSLPADSSTSASEADPNSSDSSDSSDDEDWAGSAASEVRSESSGSAGAVGQQRHREAVPEQPPAGAWTRIRTPSPDFSRRHDGAAATMPPPPPRLEGIPAHMRKFFTSTRRPRNHGPMAHTERHSVMASPTEGLPLSVGSAGHPFCCAQPCKFVTTKRGCKDAGACTHCHLCKWRKMPTKDASPTSR